MKVLKAILYHIKGALLYRLKVKSEPHQYNSIVIIYLKVLFRFCNKAKYITLLDIISVEKLIEPTFKKTY